MEVCAVDLGVGLSVSETCWSLTEGAVTFPPGGWRGGIKRKNAHSNGEPRSL